MHIHSGSMNLNSADLYSAAGAEKAADAQRAAQARRKLLKAGWEVEDIDGQEETGMVSQWMDHRHTQMPTEDEYRATNAARDSEFG